MTRRDRFNRTTGPLVRERRERREGRGMNALLAMSLPAVALVALWAQVAGGDQDPAAAAAAAAAEVTVDTTESGIPDELRTAIFVGATGMVVGGAGWLAFRMLGSHQQRLEDLEGY